MSLERYRQKRDFDRTPEPSGESAPGAEPVGHRQFVVQRHRASRLHYDFRLEIDGALASWAVPKGPSLDPAQKRAAFHVEDHPLDYFDFEGTIPKGEYGGGDVIVWDWGTFEPEETDDPGSAVRAGELKFRLDGEKLRGRFTLVRMRGDEADRESWLMIKKKDQTAAAGWDAEASPRSVKTGRTNDEVAHGTPARNGHAPPGSTDTPTFAGANQAGHASMPAFIPPMAAVLADRPFSDPGWLFELKWDGYRLQAHVRDGKVTLYTRRGLDGAGYFPELAGPVDWIHTREAIVDGEVVALNELGEPEFGLLQARQKGQRPNLVYEVFDLLYVDGRSLLDEPLETRKALLREVLVDTPRVRYAGHVEGDGKEFYEAVAARGLEGIMAKLRTSHYEPGRRSPAWMKIKRRAEQDFVIGGWAGRENDENDLGALLVGVYDGEALRPAGRVGTGFDGRERRRLLDLMAPLSQPITPFRPSPKQPNQKGVHWIEPRLVVRVEFAEWTTDGMLRAPSYKGLELDMDPRAVAREQARPADESRAQALIEVSTPATGESEGDDATDALANLEALPGSGGPWTVGGRQLKLSNLDKVLWPQDDLCKRDLIRYYVSMAPYLLPYLRGRALTLQRYPDGIESSGFWQKQVPGHAPDWIECWPHKSSTKGEVTEYLVANSVAVLAWMANEAAIDLHPSTFWIEAPDRPTWALLDIDPGPKTTWEETLSLARLFRTALDHLQLRGFPKVTGQRGIQIWIPIEPAYSFEETSGWVASLSRAIAVSAPDLVSWEWEKSKRSGLARLDYTQNAWNKTLVAPYSVRPRPGAPVSAPITWEELDDPDLRPDRWTIRTIHERVVALGDLFAPSLGLRQRLPKL